jgi:hypothetical protein
MESVSAIKHRHHTLFIKDFNTNSALHCQISCFAIPYLVELLDLEVNLIHISSDPHPESET